MPAFKPAYKLAAIPARVLDLFTVENGELHWSAVCPASWRGMVRAPWGSRAGGKPVYGRGRLINAKRMNLLTVDVAYALEHGGEWPWQINASLVPVETRDLVNADQWRDLIRARFALDGDALTWRVDRGLNADRTVRYPAGSRVGGLAMSGFREPIVATGGMTFLASDVRTVLQTGCFPWDEWN